MWYIYTMEYYSAIKKKKIMPLAAIWMDLEIIILSEVSQRKTNTIWYHLHVASKMWHKWTYLRNRNGLTDIENRRVVAKAWEGKDWEFRISRCKLLYIEWIKNKVQGTIFNILWLNHNGKEYEKECIYIYLSHLAVQQKLTQHCKSATLQ